MTRQEVLCLFPGKIRGLLEQAQWKPDYLQEIRLRVGKPVILWEGGQEYFLSCHGILTKYRDRAYEITEDEIRTILEAVSHFSLYAYEEEIGQGFFTIAGGHRVGVAGQVILEQQMVKGIRYISCLNFRFSHEIKGCADHVLPWLVDGNSIYNTLIISPPRCGKTTLLRDLIRQISNGGNCFQGCTVGVVDERSEIGGSYQGIPQNDVGIRTDLLDCCPKSQGMVMLLRSMAPQVIAVDEIGNEQDSQAIQMTLNCGCRLLATVHGASMEEAARKPLLGKMIREGVFERYVILYGIKEEKFFSVWDKDGRELT